MKYGASSSLLILDWDVNYHKFRVIRRIEVPKAEYSFDLAVQMIIELNKLYDPAFIYADRGSGEYQIESLHKYGDAHPESGLKNKVKGWQFSQTIDILDPIKHVQEKKPLKPFMVNQLSIVIDRDQLILSPFDELLHKQLVDYEVVRIGANGNPVFTSINEHFVDALGLCILGFALEFPNITQTIDVPEFKNPIEILPDSSVNSGTINKIFSAIKNGFCGDNPWGKLKNGSITYEEAQDPRERDVPHYFKVQPPVRFKTYNNWGDRGGGFGSSGRKMW